MAARTTGRAKQAGGPRSVAKVTVAKKAVTRKAPAKSPKTKRVKKQASATTTVPADGLVTGMESEMLLEQNAALRAELEQAQARIAELEELNKNVVNRIDWVIDSLQGALKH